MKWYHYIAAFFAGVFLANTVPHYVNGLSGNPFPSPFADPPGFGNSSPLINVLWGAFNLLVGYSLLRYSKLSVNNKTALWVLFAGIICMGVTLSIAFSKGSNL
ncbi:MAG: hypothetical protein FD122_3609 [Stygiobacter sp.]|nr:MAG: hypothetical protein FD122_3609 [Stygiobacter sp.]